MSWDLRLAKSIGPKLRLRWLKFKVLSPTLRTRRHEVGLLRQEFGLETDNHTAKFIGPEIPCLRKKEEEYTDMTFQFPHLKSLN